MCLAIPAKILTIKQGEGEVELGGVVRRVSLDLVPEAAVGDYVLLHTGYAISRIDEEEAKETLAMLTEMARAVEAEDAQ